MSRARRVAGRVAVAAIAAAAATCGGRSPLAPGSTVTIVAAGDIADGGPGATLTAALLDRIPGTVLTLGDNAYVSGTAEEFQRFYEPTWGRHRARTRPSPGNHDYGTANAAPYFAYFGAAAGPPGLGYFSFDLGAWHLVSLNSQVIGGAQLAWLQDDLASTGAACVLAYWHHPRFSSSGRIAETPGPRAQQVREFWDLLYRFRADVVLVGHDHLYERFARQDPSGGSDAAGIRQFTAGTGGRPLYPFLTLAPNSEARASAWGVLTMTLAPTAYAWEFVPAGGAAPPDAGSASCVR